MTWIGEMPKRQCSKGWGARCAKAKGLKCRCKCDGENHGNAVAPPLKYTDSSKVSFCRCSGAGCDRCKGYGWRG